MHILCIALRVSNQRIAHCVCRIVGTMAIHWRASDCSAVWIAVDRTWASICSVIALFRAPGNHIVSLTPTPPYCRAKIVDPEGDAQDVHRFSMRQGCLIEKSRPSLRWPFRIGREVFSLVTFFSKRKSLAHQREKGARLYLHTTTADIQSRRLTSQRQMLPRPASPPGHPPTSASTRNTSRPRETRRTHRCRAS